REAERRATRPQGRRSRTRVEHGASRTNQSLNGLFGMHPAPAQTARAKMPFNEGAISDADVVVDIRGDERVNAMTVGHTHALWRSPRLARAVLMCHSARHRATRSSARTDFFARVRCATSRFRSGSRASPRFRRRKTLPRLVTRPPHEIP